MSGQDSIGIEEGRPLGYRSRSRILVGKNEISVLTLRTSSALLTVHRVVFSKNSYEYLRIEDILLLNQSHLPRFQANFGAQSFDDQNLSGQERARERRNLSGTTLESRPGLGFTMGTARTWPLRGLITLSSASPRLSDSWL